ncbi:MAG: hypothetical protein ACJAYU_002733, partial [Bradymonadia bacterium]
DRIRAAVFVLADGIVGDFTGGRHQAAAPENADPGFVCAPNDLGEVCVAGAFDTSAAGLITEVKRGHAAADQPGCDSTLLPSTIGVSSVLNRTI